MIFLCFFFIFLIILCWKILDGFFVSDTLLKVINYEATISTNEKNFYCFKCCKGYKNKRHLRYHINFECGKLPKYKCLYCSRRAHRKSNVNDHIKNCHPGNPLLP